MASLNRISLIGNVGRDPEIKDYQGSKVATFSLAVNEKVIRNDAQTEEKVLWFRVTFWGNTADIVERFVKKGAQVYIDGKLSTSDYKDREGKDRTSLEVRGQTLTLLGSGLGGNPAEQPSYLGTNARPNNTDVYKAENYNEEPKDANIPTEDLPF